MKITRDNYEEFLVDYWDNTLPEHTRVALESFLNDNPDIRTEMDGADQMVLPSRDIAFEAKKNLFSIPTSEPILSDTEALLVAELEGDLDSEQKASLAELKRQNPALIEQAKLFALTKIRPDFSIRYPDKHKIKQNKISLFWAVGAVAAVLTLGLMVRNVVVSSDATQQAQVMPVIQESAKVERNIEVKPGTLAHVGIPVQAQKSDSVASRKKTIKSQQEKFFNEEYQEAVYEEDAPVTASIMDYRECVQIERVDIPAPVDITVKEEKPQLSEDLVNENKIFEKNLSRSLKE